MVLAAKILEIRQEATIQEIASKLSNFRVSESYKVDDDENELVSPNNGRRYRKKTQYIHRIYIRRCCLHRFSAMVGFKIERKSKDLQEIIERIKFRHICPTI